MAKLIICRAGTHRVVDLTEDVVTLGRAPENTVWLDDPSMSRHHCELRRVNEQWWVHDAGSFNGTFLNNLSCQQELLRPGDRIQFGTTVCYFVPESGDALSGGVDAGARDEAERASREATSRKLRNFSALLEISKAVSGELSRERLLTLVVQKSVGLVSAQRGFLVLLRGEETVFEVALTLEGEKVENPEPLVSSSVLERVTRTGEPVITINAQNDLGGFMSIVALEVRSLICVPLKSKERILGALYVDSQVAAQQFGDEELNLLQAFADQAAIALENAILYDEVVTSREQEKHVRTLFQRYVPEDVVNQVLQLAPGKQLSDQLTATVLFSDIRSFTAISERLKAEEVVQFLNDYLQRMVDIVMDEGGIVDKFVGDAVMAVWGAPMSRPDDARRAARAALRMLDGVQEFNAAQAALGRVQIKIGIGMHTGTLIAGNMGSDKKMEYTVIGDTVNVASRVEGLNKRLGTQLLVTAETYRAVGPGLEVRALEPMDVKGKAEKLFVYEVLPNSPLRTEPSASATEAADGEMPVEALSVTGSGTKTAPSIATPTGIEPEASAPEAEEESFEFEF